jgi:hypothetical protein
VRGAGRAPEELRRLPRLQQAPQGLLAPRLVLPCRSQHQRSLFCVPSSSVQNHCLLLLT